MVCCEECRFFEWHPFIREGDWTCYCGASDLAVDPYDSADDCEDFKEIE